MGLGRWYNRQHAGVQAAIMGAAVTGCLALVGVVITGFFSLAGDHGQSPPSSQASPHTTSPRPTPSGTHTTTSPLPPEVTIISPPNGARLPDNTFGASGTAKNIPTADSLWLVIKAPNYYRWYPVIRIKTAGDTWVVGPNRICPAGGRQNIRVFLVPNSAAGQLSAYVTHRSSQHDPGIRSMPSSAVSEAVSHLHVNFHSRKSC